MSGEDLEGGSHGIPGIRLERLKKITSPGSRCMKCFV